jgi:hypothetical protein
MGICRSALCVQHPYLWVRISLANQGPGEIFRMICLLNYGLLSNRVKGRGIFKHFRLNMSHGTNRPFYYTNGF